MQTSPGGASGGGNSTYICTQCEAEVAWTGPQALCWCGYTPEGDIPGLRYYECTRVYPLEGGHRIKPFRIRDN